MIDQVPGAAAQPEDFELSGYHIDLKSASGSAAKIWTMYSAGLPADLNRSNSIRCETRTIRKPCY